MFYERLNQLCKQHGTTITEVTTTQLGAASSAATNWKRGASPRSDIVIRAAEHFGVSTDYLLGRTDSPTPPDLLRSPTAQTAATLLCHASESARTAALAAMQAVINAIDGIDQQD